MVSLNYFVITSYDAIPPIQNDRLSRGTAGDSTGLVSNGCGYAAQRDRMG